MRTLYRRWMEDWENRLCFRTNNRVVRPFEWGLEWAGSWPCTNDSPQNGHDPETYLRVLNRLGLERSDHFFSYDRPTDYRLEGDILRFTSAVETPDPRNNTVTALDLTGRQGDAATGAPVFSYDGFTSTENNVQSAELPYTTFNLDSRYQIQVGLRYRF